MTDSGNYNNNKVFFEKHSVIFIILFLIICTCSIYFQVKDHEFINLDDNIYVIENNHVLSGLTLENIKWAFSFSNKDKCYWHPLTWISHMIDVQLWGVDAGKHHFSNLFLHVINTLLLFFTLRKMTGALWKSAFVAALFALHPINVDTVAWVAERKNLLSTSFWFIVMLAYVSYVKRPSLFRYMLVAISFVMGLLAKPMLVTLPFVLLLLDYWPLKRITVHDKERSIPFNIIKLLKSRMIIEKIPLVFIAFISAYISMLSLKQTENIISTEQIPMDIRIGNAFISYIAYILKFVWPFDLAVYYPYPVSIPSWQIAGAFFIIVCISIVVIRSYRNHPYLPVGWLWFVGTLIPVSGIYQAGLWPAMADRWAYVPFIGIFIMISWGVPDLFNKWHYRNIVLATLAGVFIPILMVSSWVQIGYWRNSEMLFRHAINVTNRNFLAHNLLGVALFDRGDVSGAIDEYQRSLKIRPYYTLAYSNLGLVFLKEKKFSEASLYFQKCLNIDPGYVRAYNGLGDIMLNMGNNDEAIQYYTKSLQINQYQEKVFNQIGAAYYQKKNMKKAVAFLQEAVRLKPSYTIAADNLIKAKHAQSAIEQSISKIKSSVKDHPNNPEPYIMLAEIYCQQDEYSYAVNYYQKALSIQPNSIGALNGLVNAYSSRHEYIKALDILQIIRRIQPGNPDVYYNISCIYAKQGKVDESINRLKQAIGRGFNNWNLITTDPDLANIRNTPYVIELIKNH